MSSLSKRDEDGLKTLFNIIHNDTRYNRLRNVTIPLSRSLFGEEEEEEEVPEEPAEEPEEDVDEPI